MSDDIRAALAAYAATTPDLDPRAGLPERIARHHRRHRAAVAGIACFAALVAGAGFAVLTGDRDTVGLTATPTATATTEPGVPTGTPEPTVTVEPVDPTPTASPTDEPDETTQPTADPTTAPPRPSPTQSWFGGLGLEVDAELTPTSIATAAQATLRVHMADDDGSVNLRSIDWGDGTREDNQIISGPCPPPPSPMPASRERRPSSIDATREHAWRHAGTYVVKVLVESSTWCAQPPGREEQVERTFRVTVSAGAATSNGPAQPTAEGRLDGLRMERIDSDEYKVWGTVSDSDGYVRSVTVDWGDGSEPAVATNKADCDDGNGRHYPESRLRVEDTEHKFQAPGRYTVTLSWVSTGCGGADEQRGERTYTVDVPIGD